MANHPPPAPIPTAGNLISISLSLVTFGVLAVCLTRRLQAVGRWKSLPFTNWLILAIYIDSTLFVFVTAIISRGLGINDSPQVCEGAILLCLICYMTTKVLIYLFLVEKAYIIRGSRNARMKDKLFLFNFFGMIVPYLVVIVLNFIFRIAYINENGVCIIGMKKIAMLPLISFDVVVNVYLTLLFLLPLRKLYSYQHNKNTSLHSMALRTFLGSCATLVSSVVNLTVLMVLKGEPGWICLMCCNADILFSVLVLHWVTANDSNRSVSGSSPGNFTDRLDSIHRSSNFPGVSSNTTPRRESVQVWSGKRSMDQNRIGGVVTTECMGVAASKDGRGSEDEIMEMHTITVKTEHTREVEVDGQSETQSSRSEFRNMTERAVSTEKMV
ncbi:uncharacterized protein BDR25DRAFT_293412 [Lindgomyces ingoldianus]|uniref:Uncharacterized protein n=1 Tax=Lindgomyces ingoldianus TaxID=673940 RepID=A0ACB6QHN3_9PLEO|nr:uncharacterized protein BDR25DRAFT_293412 [Lindgomyces ingoldianus]KAF2466504.1 hypothetical protein BDR25DRAFT_293412 [Lindgomyces ingoldianus]